ncbi:hypothetical protein CR513_33148, partial [Mucuna pruriens]
MTFCYMTLQHGSNTTFAKILHNVDIYRSLTNARTTVTQYKAPPSLLWWDDLTPFRLQSYGILPFEYLPIYLLRVALNRQPPRPQLLCQPYSCQKSLILCLIIACSKPKTEGLFNQYPTWALEDDTCSASSFVKRPIYTQCPFLRTLASSSSWEFGVNSLMKSAFICPLLSYTISNSNSSIAHPVILLAKYGFLRICLIGDFESMVTLLFLDDYQAYYIRRSDFSFFGTTPNLLRYPSNPHLVAVWDPLSQIEGLAPRGGFAYARLT